MKKILLSTAIGIFMTVGAMAQNVIQNSDFEAQGSWGVKSAHETVEFGYTTDTPYDGEGGCLRVADFDGNTWEDESYVYQTISLQAGATYEFSGLIKAAQTGNFWVQIALMPVNGWDMDLNGVPDWATWGIAQPTIFKATHHDLVAGGGEFDVIDGEFADYDNSNYNGSFTGEYDGDMGGTAGGDTTVFTVPEDFPNAKGDYLNLGDAGDAVDFYFVIYIGASGKDLDLLFDNLSIVKIEDPTATNEMGADKSNVSVYPNPVANELNVSNATGISSVSIINIVGTEVYSEICEGNATTINTSSLNSGIYIINITDTNGVVTSKKLVKN